MHLALEFRGVFKRYATGVGGCIARADVLRSIDFGVAEGEAVAIAGDRGAGKSTLLLCAAGLLSVDAGEVRWFGERSRAIAVARTSYHFAGSPPAPARGAPCAAHVHLIEQPACGGDALARMARRIGEARDRGDAVIVTTRELACAERLGSRVFVLRGGYLDAYRRPRRRVAEEPSSGAR
ncbi:MAG TPA: ABC transporter ATP-binding protein [Gemmatimonadaceae bacterium]|nr:ABC transporter ATP-binding protein [Gemmatimonadaceae bacterium]